MKYPLCVDLDGTLIYTDTLFEGLLAAISKGSSLRELPCLVATSRAALKKRIGELVSINPELLPFNKELICFLEERKRLGHKLVLVTAADERVARAVNDHLQLFDEVIASDGKTNLKGKNKASALVARFGFKGFDYIGNDASDLPVWRAASGIFVANASPRIYRAASKLGSIQAHFNLHSDGLRPALQAIRPHQWSKNLLVFVPMVTAQAWTDLSSWVAALIMFLSFCATASAVYLVNDLFDITGDRQHPRKRNRPLARGALSIPFAFGLAILLLAIGLSISIPVGGLTVILVYAALSFAYSLALKTFPLVDVFVLAALYTLRVIGGGVATEHRATLWLLAFSGFTFLSLALVKRTGELLAARATIKGDAAGRRGYMAGDHILLQTFGCAAAFASSVVLALFVGSLAATINYRTPEFLWLVVPLVLFWQCRLWLSTARGHMHDDPIVYAFRDWVSWVVAGSTILVLLSASSGIVPFF